MLKLPQALAAWHTELDIFPREVASALSPLVQQISRLMGPLHATRRYGEGDPDGFSGLSQRGTYERLLASEWLLADEAPLEFMRRAAAGEHTFLQLARREPQGAPLSMVLFDAGPNQLGSPRIAHLAALIVLQSRARQSGAHFRWGVLQHPSVWHQTLGEANVRELLLARSTREATEKDWHDCLGAIADVHVASQPLDLWVVGGDRLQRLTRVLDNRESSPRLLCVQENWQPAQRELLVRVVRPDDHATAHREITLSLPPEASCVRLLRDPFSSVVATAQRTGAAYATQSNLLWASATKLLAITHDGALLSQNVPNSPRAQAGKPRFYQPSFKGRIVAAGHVRKATIAVTLVNPSVVSVEVWGKGAHRVPQGRFRLPFSQHETRDNILMPCCLVAYGTSFELLALLSGRTLLKIPAKPSSTKDNSANHTRDATIDSRLALEDSDSFSDTTSSWRAEYISQNALALLSRSDDALFVSGTQGIFSYRQNKKLLLSIAQPIKQAFVGATATGQSLVVTHQDERWLLHAMDSAPASDTAPCHGSCL
jgi:hypothetical protein